MNWSMHPFLRLRWFMRVCSKNKVFIEKLLSSVASPMSWPGISGCPRIKTIQNQTTVSLCLLPNAPVATPFFFLFLFLLAFPKK